MTRRFGHLVLAFAAGVILLGIAGSAQAGFLTADALPSESMSGMSQPTSDKSPTPHKQLHQQNGFNVAHSGGGMSSQTLSNPVGNGLTAAADLSSPKVSPGQLQLRMARQRDRYHPRFIKSRLFRPPRG